jgi:hypothetical protein
MHLELDHPADLGLNRLAALLQAQSEEQVAMELVHPTAVAQQLYVPLA